MNMKQRELLKHLREAEFFSREMPNINKLIIELMGAVRHIETAPTPVIVEREVSQVVLTYTKNHFAPYTVYIYYPQRFGSEAKIEHYKDIDDAIDRLEEFPENKRSIDEDTFIDLDKYDELKRIKNREEVMFKEWMKGRVGKP